MPSPALAPARPVDGVEPVHVRLRGVTKQYGARPALSDIDLEIARGSVHALVGENGAGKSTLGKVIAGIVARSSGDLEIDGIPADFASPRDALARGVTAITQELSLVPGLSVLDNVFLGREQAHLGVRTTRPLLDRYRTLTEIAGFAPDPRRLVSTMALADQQKVEILRALARDAQLIVFDEPTTVLDASETAQLHEMIRRLQREGTTVVYVSHFLEEVLELADAVTVLRDGQLIRTAAAADETTGSLITAMLGRELSERFPEKTPPTDGAPIVLETRGLSSGSRVRDVSLQLRAGEIVGVAGLVGSGRTELLRAIFAADRPTGGELIIGGRTRQLHSPRDAIDAGLAFVPEDRRAQGLVINRSIRENVTLATLDRVTRHGLVDRAGERRAVEDAMDKADVRSTGPEATVESLSGGNQQKVLFAKWLLAEPAIFLADEPTRGVDIGAKRGIYDLLVEAAGRGTAVLLVSSEIEEIIGLAHRVLVMREGRCVAELVGDQICETEVTTAAFGTTEEAAR